MTRSFYTDTVTRLRAPLVDDGHGNMTENWDEPASADIWGCRVQPLSSAEVLEHRQAGLEVTKRLLAPYASGVLSTDRIVFAGVTYEVGDDPANHRSPSGAAAHDEILLRRFDG